MLDGRWLTASDTKLHIQSAVLGAGIAKQYGYLPGENPHDPAEQHELRRRRRARDRRARPRSRQRGVHHAVGGEALLLDRRQAEPALCSLEPSKTQATADAIPTAINLGGPDEVSTKVPSDVLQAASQADKTLQQTALFAGLLALAVGGLGIANVMSISVIQRSSEIGIRRAVGHSRSKIGLQFLLESLFVGILGGILGAAVGVGIVYLVSSFADWVVVIAYQKIPIWMALALGVSVVAGLYPSVKAARLEPLETLRLG